ncbi:MAG: NUDIX domain-containing protein [Deltaproteobacteria bacterium]|nr:NUDIX domain-containing protein [Deltaproteobacteria bacterium]
MKDVGVVVHLLRYSAGKLQILFLCRAWGLYKHQWWPIAGNIRNNEIPSDTAFREVKEETGLLPEPLYDTGMKVPRIGPDAGQDEHIRIYAGFVPPEAEVRLNHEHSDFKWLDFNEAKNIVTPKAVAITGYVLGRIKEGFVDKAPPASLRILPPS